MSEDRSAEVVAIARRIALALGMPEDRITSSIPGSLESICSLSRRLLATGWVKPGLSVPRGVTTPLSEGAMALSERFTGLPPPSEAQIREFEEAIGFSDLRPPPPHPVLGVIDSRNIAAWEDRPNEYASPKPLVIDPLQVVEMGVLSDGSPGLFRLPHGHPRHPDTRFVPTKDAREAVFTPTPPGYVVGVDFAAELDPAREVGPEFVGPSLVGTDEGQTGVLAVSPYRTRTECGVILPDGSRCVLPPNHNPLHTRYPGPELKTVYADAWDAHGDPMKGAPVRRMSREAAEARFPRTDGGEFSMPEADAELAKQDPTEPK